MLASICSTTVSLFNRSLGSFDKHLTPTKTTFIAGVTFGLITFSLTKRAYRLTTSWWRYYRITKIDPQHLPKHIAIIPDGNRRWAKAKKVPVAIGHQTGANNILHVAQEAFTLGIKTMTFYCLSTENFQKRPEGEMSKLNQIIDQFFAPGSRIETEFINKGIRLKTIGNLSYFSPERQEKLKMIEEKSQHNTKATIVLAFGYGGRDEIVRATRRIIKERILEPDLTEETMTSHLDTSGITDPDLVIRTGGEQRISNFLPWQSTYSEFLFVKNFWPSFSTNDLNAAIWDYVHRQRNFGR